MPFSSVILFELIVWNARSLLPSLDELKILTNRLHPGLIFISETWLTHKHSIKFPPYSVYRQDRHPLRRGGGVMLLVQLDILHFPVPLQPYANGTLEVLAAKFYIHDAWFHILGVYFPGHDDIFNIHELDFYISQLEPPFFIVGDFNALHRSWSLGRANVAGNTLNSYIADTDTLALFTPYNLGTRLNVTTGLISTIDLAFGSPTLYPYTTITRLGDCGSDHFPFRLSYSDSEAICRRKLRRKWILPSPFPTAQWHSAVNTGLASSSYLDLTDINEMSDWLVSSITKAAAETFRLTSGHFSSRFRKSWWNEACSKAVAERRRARRNLTHKFTIDNMVTYKHICAKTKIILKRAKRSSWMSFCNTLNVHSSSAEVWSKFRSVSGRPKITKILLVSNDVPILRPDAVSNALAVHFATVDIPPLYPHIRASPKALIDALVQTPMPPYDDLFTLSEMNTILKSLPSGKAAGEDGLCYEFFKFGPPLMHNTMLDIFNLSWSNHKVPDTFKSGILLPFLKPGKDPTSTKSYRPITLLPTLGKILEKLVNQRLYRFAESRNLFGACQSGFRVGRSATDNLLRLDNAIRESLVSRGVTLVVYLDIQAAFDSIVHERLISRLIESGVTGHMLGWIMDFLSGRSFKVFVDGEFSRSHDLFLGVPQGSILSPILFIILLGCLHLLSRVKLALYADDMALFISADTLAEATTLMQEALNKVGEWARTWGFIINASKCSFQTYSRKHNLPIPILRYNNQVLQHKTVVKFLGLYLDAPLLTWKSHIAELVKVCTTRMAPLRAVASTSWGGQRDLLLRFYTAFIRRKIAYGCHIFGSACKSLLGKLETVQNQCLRTVSGALCATPLDALRCELAIPALLDYFDECSCLALIKLFHLPEDHILIKEIWYSARTHSLLSWSTINHPSFIFRVGSLLYRISSGDFPMIRSPCSMLPISHTCLKVPDIHIIPDFMGPNLNSLQKRTAFLEHCATKFSDHTQIFTDGSLQSHPGGVRVSAALCIPAFHIAEGWRLPNKFTITTAEIVGILKAFQFIKSCPIGQFLICVDSQPALLSLLSGYNGLHGSLIQQCIQLYNSLKTLHYSISFMWVPSHCGVHGNECADRTASEALAYHTIDPVAYTIGDLRLWCRSLFLNKLKDDWSTSFPSTHLGIIKQSWGRWPWSSIFSRRSEVVLARLRLGVTKLRYTLYNMKAVESPNCLSCGVPETVSHVILFCRLHRSHRSVFQRQLASIGVPDLTLRNVLGGGDYPHQQQMQILFYLISYLQVTKIFDSI